jgi:general L-amino acid transport system permease protein
MTDLTQRRAPEQLFSSGYVRRHPLNAVLSALLLAGLAYVGWIVINWAFVNSVTNAHSMAECRSIGSGACWAVVGERGRLVIFGLYPFEEQWRALLACGVLLAGAILSCLPRFHSVALLVSVWLVSFLLFTVLMGGGMLGLRAVPQANWGGLALSFYIFAAILIVGIPLAIVFALIRHTGPDWASLPVGLLIDSVRSIPLTVILFFMALVMPTLIPGWIAGEKLSRVVAGFAIFFSCYQAEILRGALQALSKGQVEASRALGLSYWQTQVLVVLPQIFRTALPQTVNQIVAAFKDTSYVAIVGFFDMTASASAALGTGEWATGYVEIYLLVAVIYLAFGYSLSRYGGYLETKADKAHSR